jgi:hypothetical protein
VQRRQKIDAVEIIGRAPENAAVDFCRLGKTAGSLQGDSGLDLLNLLGRHEKAECLAAA